MELRRRYAERHWVYRPHYAELMAELGDTSKVAEVLALHWEGKYRSTLISRPDDSAASLDAADAADRLLERYGEGVEKEKEGRSAFAAPARCSQA